MLLALVLLLAASVAAGVLWLRDDSAGYPDAWDGRVQKYVDFVEQERDLEFKHPIHVDFLPVKDFKKQVTTDKEDLSEKDREEIEHSTGMLRALGLIEGELDLFDTMNELQGAGILGYYSDDDEQIRIRGTKLTPAVRSTLVHELTHALQDQHYDLEERQDKLEKADDSAASSGFEALVEGDASRIESAWAEGLGEKDQKALEESEAEQSEGFGKDAEDIPAVLQTLISSPYLFGEALLQIAVQQGGEREVDKLFGSPPTTDEHQLDPWTLVEDEQVPVEVVEPALAEDEKEFDDGPFGAISWLLVLAERIPARQALAAADGWGGDAYVAYERDEVSCVRVHYEGDSAGDLDQMQAALTAWVKRVPAGPASVRRDGSMLVFESCDPGTKATAVATGNSQEAVTAAISRTYLSSTLVEAGFTTSAARCSSDRLVRAFTVAELNDPDVDQKRVSRVIAPCRT